MESFLLVELVELFPITYCEISLSELFSERLRSVL